jgi:DNA-binding MarR family transcriptional regulator
MKLLDIKDIVNEKSIVNAKPTLSQQVMMAAQEQGISSVLFRNAIGRKLGLNSTEGECLSFLAIKGVSTPTEISRYTGLTSGSTTTMLDRLEKAGFIQRKPNPNDRRGVLIEISKKWAQTAGPLVADLVQNHCRLISTYSEEQLETIADFLTRFTENVKRQTATLDQK